MPHVTSTSFAVRTNVVYCKIKYIFSVSSKVKRNFGNTRSPEIAVKYGRHCNTENIHNLWASVQL